ncbi:MAG: MBL fold metallo-hydrolase [Porticoccaceae bacterium]
MAKIIHHGAVDGVTGSCHQLFFPAGESLLVDCGLFQGAEARGRVDMSIDFPLAGIRALLLTHCHIDHCGRVPWLLGAGFDGPIYATQATAKLLPLVLEDAIKVGVSRDGGLIRKIMTRLEGQLVPVAYDRWFPLRTVQGDVVNARFRRAGHILGSAYVEVDVGKGADCERIVFSGDLGAPHTPLLPAPKPPYKADTLVIESTYGDRVHDGRKNRRKALQRVIEHCFHDAGAVLIPAFSIGRTQELLYEIEEIIHRYKKGGRSKLDWQNVDVVVDSPLAAAFTESYREMRELWDAEARQRLSEGRHPLNFEQLITVDKHENHLRLVEYLKQSGRPAIVIAASGMCAGGRIVNYLKALLPDSRTDVLFVGYQAEGTPGRDIQRYGPEQGYVVLDGERVQINAGIHTISGYSAHAGQDDLLRFIRRIYKKPREIRIVHGDADAKAVFAEKVREICPDVDVLVP